MKIMFLYPNSDGYFRCPIGLTLIMTVLAEEGHEIKLFDTTFMAVGENNDNKFSRLVIFNFRSFVYFGS